jgi:hypothetical protein
MALPVRPLVLQKIGNLHWEVEVSFLLSIRLFREIRLLRVAVSACSFSRSPAGNNPLRFRRSSVLANHPMEGALGYRVFCSVHRA